MILNFQLIIFKEVKWRKSIYSDNKNPITRNINKNRLGSVRKYEKCGY